MSTNESTVNKSIGKTVGIIAEYNPFHNGHLYQIEKIREEFDDAYIVAIMSGNFTQRGEAAILDKWQRDTRHRYVARNSNAFTER